MKELAVAPASRQHQATAHALADGNPALESNDAVESNDGADDPPASPEAHAHRSQLFAHWADDPPTVADAGTTGSGDPLPHHDAIQRAFGSHDVGDLRAHFGVDASAAADQLGAAAYTRGDRIAFDGDPDLHTAAHEAAHAVQQRAGLSRGLDGGATDPLEHHANTVADAVVRGEPAHALLDQLVGTRMNAGPSVGIQRQPKDPKVDPKVDPKTDPKPDPNPQTDQKDAPQPDKPAPPPVTADNVKDHWTEKLDPFVKDSIDRTFNTSDANARVKRAATAAQREIDRNLATDKAALREATKRRLTVGNKPPTERQIADDKTFQDESRRLDTAAADKRARASEDAKDKDDSSADSRNTDRNETIADEQDPTITRQQGQGITRSDFQKFGEAVFGSDVKAQKHYESLTKVGRNENMYLAGDAAARWKLARADFEKAHPGYTVPESDEAFSLRGFQEKRNGIGMLGHAIGESADLVANDTPNTRFGPGWSENYDYLLKKFGGISNQRGTGRAILELGVSDPVIEKMGKATANDPTKAPDKEGQTMLNTIGTQYQQMADTSDRFRQSFGATNLAELQIARDIYFGKPAVKAELDKLERRGKAPDSAIQERLKAEKFTGDARQKAARVAAIKAEYATELAKKRQEYTGMDTSVNAVMKDSFKGWTKSIDGDIAADQQTHIMNDARLGQLKVPVAAFKSVDPKGKDADAALDGLAVAFGLPTRDKLAKKPKDAAAYKAMLLQTLTTRDATEIAKLTKSNASADADIKSMQKWQQRFLDPKFVFGNRDLKKEAKAKDGRTRTKYEASDVPLIQLLENGFARNDAMPARTGAKDLKPVFNKDMMVTLAKYGFAPGAAFHDTQHFDFVEGYNANVVGGRSFESMNTMTFGPKGLVITPQKKK